MADNKRALGALKGQEMHPRGDEEGDSECKSAKAIRLLREVTTLLSETTDQASRHIARGQLGASGSSALQNVRTLFAPYRQSSVSLSSSVPTKKNTAKPKFFQPKETWTHDFFCLASKEQVRAPSRAEKFDLQEAGLGRKKICFHSKAKFPELCKKLEEEYPKLSQGGGFEIMRTGHQGSNTILTTITPPASGYSVHFLRDSSGLGQALAYIRPLQRDLDRSPVVKETLESADAVLIDCLNCGKKVALSEWHAHDSNCGGGASCSGSSGESCIPDSSAETKGESLKTSSLLNRGCLVETLKEMFPGETEDDLITTLTRNNFDLEISVNEVLCSEGGVSNSIHVESELESDTELAESPFTTSATSTPQTPKPQFSTLSELLQDHKHSLKLVEGNVKRLTVRRDEFWKEAIATFKNPEFDYTASPSIVFEGEAGVDAGGLRREYGALLCQAIFSATANLFEGPEDRKLPIYSIDGIHSRLFKLAGSMVAYLIIHLDASIPCLSPTVYKYIESGSISPEFCSIDDVVDLELKELIEKVNAATSDDDILQIQNDHEFLGNALITAGWLQPLTMNNRDLAMQAIIVHDVLTKRKEPLDQFCKGLKTLGIYDLIKSQPELMQAYFLSSAQVPFTSQDLINCLDIDEEDKDKKARQFLVQAIRNLEKEQGHTGLSKFLHFMTSLDRIPPLGLKRKIEVEFSISTNPTFFAETCGFVLRVPTVHETFERFEDKFLEATENYLGYGSI